MTVVDICPDLMLAGLVAAFSAIFTSSTRGKKK
jgi:hypothetical protein